jgi:hypothetical protein
VPPVKNDPAVDPKSDPSVTPQTTVARSDKSSTPKSANPPKMGNTPSGTKTTSPNPPKSNSNPGVAKGGSPATTNPRAPETSKTTTKPANSKSPAGTASPVTPATGTAKTAPAKPNTGRPAPTTPAAEPEKPKLGVLKPAGRDRFESTAGLVYSQYRIDHVMEHARDIPDKPTHGVFEGSRDEILALIDEAYQLSQKRGPPQVVIEDEGDRTTYTVNLNRKIGHGGGQSGARRRNPPLKMVKIVLEGDEVITAFPTDR